MSIDNPDNKNGPETDLTSEEQLIVDSVKNILEEEQEFKKEYEEKGSSVACVYGPAVEAIRSFCGTDKDISRYMDSLMKTIEQKLASGEARYKEEAVEQIYKELDEDKKRAFEESTKNEVKRQSEGKEEGINIIVETPPERLFKVFVLKFLEKMELAKKQKEAETFENVEEEIVNGINEDVEQIKRTGETITNSAEELGESETGIREENDQIVNEAGEQQKKFKEALEQLNNEDVEKAMATALWLERGGGESSPEEMESDSRNARELMEEWQKDSENKLGEKISKLDEYIEILEKESDKAGEHLEQNKIDDFISKLTELKEAFEEKKKEIKSEKLSSDKEDKNIKLENLEKLYDVGKKSKGEFFDRSDKELKEWKERSDEQKKEEIENKKREIREKIQISKENLESELESAENSLMSVIEKMKEAAGENKKKLDELLEKGADADVNNFDLEKMKESLSNSSEFVEHLLQMEEIKYLMESEKDKLGDLMETHKERDITIREYEELLKLLGEFQIKIEGFEKLEEEQKKEIAEGLFAKLKEIYEKNPALFKKLVVIGVIASATGLLYAAGLAVSAGSLYSMGAGIGSKEIIIGGAVLGGAGGGIYALYKMYKKGKITGEDLKKTGLTLAAFPLAGIAAAIAYLTNGKNWDKWMQKLTGQQVPEWAKSVEEKK